MPCPVDRCFRPNRVKLLAKLEQSGEDDGCDRSRAFNSK